MHATRVYFYASLVFTSVSVSPSPLHSFQVQWVGPSPSGIYHDYIGVVTLCLGIRFIEDIAPYYHQNVDVVCVKLLHKCVVALESESVFFEVRVWGWCVGFPPWGRGVCGGGGESELARP